MYGNGTPWGYIRQKKKTEEAQSEVHKLKSENEKLKNIIKKIIKKQSLNDEEKKILEKLSR